MIPCQHGLQCGLHKPTRDAWYLLKWLACSVACAAVTSLLLVLVQNRLKLSWACLHVLQSYLQLHCRHTYSFGTDERSQHHYRLLHSTKMTCFQLLSTPVLFHNYCSTISDELCTTSLAAIIAKTNGSPFWEGFAYIHSIIGYYSWLYHSQDHSKQFFSLLIGYALQIFAKRINYPFLLIIQSSYSYFNLISEMYMWGKWRGKTCR